MTADQIATRPVHITSAGVHWTCALLLRYKPTQQRWRLGRAVYRMRRASRSDSMRVRTCSAAGNKLQREPPTAGITERVNLSSSLERAITYNYYSATGVPRHLPVSAVTPSALAYPSCPIFRNGPNQSDPFDRAFSTAQHRPHHSLCVMGPYVALADGALHVADHGTVLVIEELNAHLMRATTSRSRGWL
jgi:hypothetical protein